MYRSLSPHRVIGCVLLCAAALALSSAAAERLSPEEAGDIAQPTGQIAFSRDRGIWTMNADGSHQKLICEATNADGRLSWAPDGKRIAFTRSGMVDLRGPDLTGGTHKVYDLFIAYVDSAESNTFWWTQLTSDMGSRDPEWSTDGKSIIFFKDMHANAVNAQLPNYQVCVMNPDNGEIEILREDWRNMTEYMIAPSMNREGEIVFVHFASVRQTVTQSNFKSLGLGKLHRDGFMATLDSIRALSAKMPDAVGPAWSPDGKWIAYVFNSMTNPGIYICTPDFSERHLVFSPPPATTLYTMAPSFSPDSKWLTFATTDGSVWICDITGNGTKRLTGPGLDLAPAWSKAPPKKATTGK